MDLVWEHLSSVLSSISDLLCHVENFTYLCPYFLSAKATIYFGYLPVFSVFNLRGITESSAHLGLSQTADIKINQYFWLSSKCSWTHRDNLFFCAKAHLLPAILPFLSYQSYSAILLHRMHSLSHEDKEIVLTTLSQGASHRAKLPQCEYRELSPTTIKQQG